MHCGCPRSPERLLCLPPLGQDLESDPTSARTSWPFCHLLTNQGSLTSPPTGCPPASPVPASPEKLTNKLGHMRVVKLLHARRFPEELFNVARGDDVRWGKRVGGRDGGSYGPSSDPRLLGLVFQMSRASQGQEKPCYRSGATEVSPLADAFHWTAQQLKQPQLSSL